MGTVSNINVYKNDPSPTVGEGLSTLRDNQTAFREMVGALPPATVTALGDNYSLPVTSASIILDVPNNSQVRLISIRGNLSGEVGAEDSEFHNGMIIKLCGVSGKTVTLKHKGDNSVASYNIRSIDNADIVLSPTIPTVLTYDSDNNIWIERERTSTILSDTTGNLNNLTTTNKTNLVAAINEVKGNTSTNATNISNLSSKVGTGTINSKVTNTNVVAAINDLITKIDLPLSSLTTSVKTSLITAINSLVSDKADKADVGTLSNLTTTEKGSIVGAINEVVSNLGTSVGDLTTLSTTNKSSVVSAINEIYGTSGVVHKSGDETITGKKDFSFVRGKPQNVNLSTTYTSSKDDYPFYILKNSSDTTHTGNLMRLGVNQRSGTKNYSLLMGVANPRSGNLPSSTAGGASTSNCWGGIGVEYNYDLNKAYAYSSTSEYDVSDSSPHHIPSTQWVKTATGDFACNAATATTLKTARSINISDADGTNTGTAISFNGSANGTIKLPATIKATLTGNASTATKATQDGDGNTISSTYLKLSGGTLTGSVFFTDRICGINKDNSTDDANTLFPEYSGAKQIYYTTSNGNTKLENIPSLTNTTLESYTVRCLSSTDWHIHQVLHNTASNGLWYRQGTYSGWSAWKNFAFTDSNITGTAVNVTGTVAIANGGTGATTRLNAIKALTNENVSTNATHFLGLKSDWSKVGYVSIADTKSVLGINDKAEDTSVVHITGNETIAGTKTFSSTIAGSINGNAATATKATQDEDGNTIKTTYAKLDSPTFTGTPKAPTASASTNNTQIATTAFVKIAISDKTNDADAIHKTGNETVSGTKTFSSTVTHESNGQVGFSSKITGNATLRDYVITDSSDSRISLFRGKLATNGSREAQLVAVGGSSLNTFGTIAVGVTASDEVYTKAPSTPSTAAANAIVTKDYADAIDTNAVHKTGDETVAGEKTLSGNTTISKSSPILSLQMLNLDTTQVSSSNKYYSAIGFCDKNGLEFKNRTAVIRSGTSNIDSNFIEICAVNPTVNSTAEAHLSVHYTRDGKAKAAAPSTLTADDVVNSTMIIGDTDIITRDFIPKDTRIVHTTGNETIAGTKTFSSTIAGSIDGNAATATKATQDENGRNIASGYMWRDSYERIVGTSTEHKDLNDYTNAGFYNMFTQYVDNVPVGIGTHAVLLVYPWKPGSGDGTKFSSQEITEAYNSANCRRWIRKQNNGVWSEWKQLAFDDDVVHETYWRTRKLNRSIAEAITATSTAPYTLTTTDIGSDYKEILFKFEHTSAQTAAAAFMLKVYFSDNNTILTRINNFLSTAANNYTYLRIVNNFGLFECYSMRATNNSLGAWNSLAGGTGSVLPVIGSPDATITKVELYSSSSSVTQIPSGFAMYSWGRK